MKRVLIVGSFHHPKNIGHYISAAEQLAALFKKHNIPVITATRQYRKLLKLIATIWTIFIQRKRFDIAILPLYGTPMNFIWHESASILLTILRKKIIVAVHGGSIPEQISRGEQKFFKALNRADKIVCPSAFISDFLKLYGYDAIVIENVLDIGAYPFHGKKAFRPHIFWMRSFSEIYNPHMAVRTAKILAKKFPDFKMVMAGSDHGLLDVIKRMVDTSGLHGKIIFPGYISQERKIKYAQDFDIFINTNRVDNAPVSIVENMALGLAIVSVNVGGIPYMIKNGINGLLVKPDDHKQMADAIERIIRDPLMASRLCKQANEDSIQFDESRVLNKWVELFQKI